MWRLGSNVSSGRLEESTVSVSSEGGKDAGEDVCIVSLERLRDSCGTAGAGACGWLGWEDTGIAFVLSSGWLSGLLAMRCRRAGGGCGWSVSLVSSCSLLFSCCRLRFGRKPAGVLLLLLYTGGASSCSLLPSCRSRYGWLLAFALLLLLLTGGAAFSESLTMEVSGSWCWGLLLRRNTISNPSGPCLKLDDELLLLPGVGLLHRNRG